MATAALPETPRAPTGTSELMTSRELNEFLKVNKNWAAEMRCSRQGPPYIKMGTLIRYDRSQVLAWLSEQTVQLSAA